MMKKYKWVCSACGGTGTRLMWDKNVYDHRCQSCWGKGQELTAWGKLVGGIGCFFSLIFYLILGLGRILLVLALIIFAVFVAHTYFPELTGKIVEILRALLDMLRKLLGIVR